MLVVLPRLVVKVSVLSQIDMEEYGVALDLARKYRLDCDLVYQRQWRNCPVSVTSIQDYLVSTFNLLFVLADLICAAFFTVLYHVLLLVGQ